MSPGLLIHEVAPGSIAEELGLEPGDRLLAINGTLLRDLIDYEFQRGDDFLTLEVHRASGELWEIEVERNEGEPLGLAFAPPRPKRCGNNCLFCFVHQLPKGLRKPLYVKDEDYRLSFLYGTYLTLTNLALGDLMRIKEQRLSPLYVSVHATDPLVRERLLGKSGIPSILDLLHELTDAGITLHCQVVICPGINDGEVLARTVADLAGLHPRIASLAIVPLGLTSHRQNLPRLEPVTPEYAAAFIRTWQPEALRLAEQLDEPFLFLADEFFIRADMPFPLRESYGDFPQVENGVGMVPLFLDEAKEAIREATPLPPLAATVVTGVSPYRFLDEFLGKLSTLTGTDIRTVQVPSLLFGESVTVTGLVAGNDIIAGLQGKRLGDVVIIPDVMLKEGEGRFLDDLTVADIERALSVEILVTPSDPLGFWDVFSEYSRHRQH